MDRPMSVAQEAALMVSSRHPGSVLSLALAKELLMRLARSRPVFHLVWLAGQELLECRASQGFH